MKQPTRIGRTARERYPTGVRTGWGSPALLKAATGQIADNEELGGSEMHARVTGLVEYLADDDSQAIEITRDIVENIPKISSKNSYNVKKLESKDTINL